MAKRHYTGMKLSITAAFAGATMLTAGWLAETQANANSTPALAQAGITTQEVVEALATATPAAANSPTKASPVVVPTATVAAAQPTTTSSSTGKTSRGS
jgi:hypothetical protein